MTWRGSSYFAARVAVRRDEATGEACREVATRSSYSAGDDPQAEGAGATMKYQVWECKIVVPVDATLPTGFDLVPRHAACQAVANAGIEVVACFSGWGGQISVSQEIVIES